MRRMPNIGGSKIIAMKKIIEDAYTKPLIKFLEDKFSSSSIKLDDVSLPFSFMVDSPLLTPKKTKEFDISYLNILCRLYRLT
ncbi:TPA: hypothetical protein EYP70_07495 [Candidatus Bathyarchaeota archaeon]|nr:hypothetical protein [Candidatus Bathyarchaeota archaeon]